MFHVSNNMLVKIQFGLQQAFIIFNMTPMVLLHPSDSTPIVTAKRVQHCGFMPVLNMLDSHTCHCWRFQLAKIATLPVRICHGHVNNCILPTKTVPRDIVPINSRDCPLIETSCTNFDVLIWTFEVV